MESVLPPLGAVLATGEHDRELVNLRELSALPSRLQVILGDLLPFGVHLLGNLLNPPAASGELHFRIKTVGFIPLFGDS